MTDEAARSPQLRTAVERDYDEGRQPDVDALADEVWALDPTDRARLIERLGTEGVKPCDRCGDPAPNGENRLWNEPDRLGRKHLVGEFIHRCAIEAAQQGATAQGSLDALVLAEAGANVLDGRRIGSVRLYRNTITPDDWQAIAAEYARLASPQPSIEPERASVLGAGPGGAPENRNYSFLQDFDEPERAVPPAEPPTYPNMPGKAFVLPKPSQPRPKPVPSPPPPPTAHPPAESGPATTGSSREAEALRLLRDCRLALSALEVTGPLVNELRSFLQASSDTSQPAAGKGSADG